MAVLLGEGVNEAGGRSDGGVSDSLLGFQAINPRLFLLPLHFLSFILFVILLLLPMCLQLMSPALP